MTGQREQRTFVSIARQRIPDWQALRNAGEEERASVAEILNALLPATGGKGTWSGIDAAALALPDAGKPILDHLKGANLAFAEVVDADGTRTIYYALSGGKRARNIHLRPNPALPDGTRFVDARAAMQGVAPLPEITSLPVLRHADDTRTLVFDRSVDSERLIASCMGEHRQVVSFKLRTVLGTCFSCGGVVLPQMRARFPDAQTFSVRYLEDYGTSFSGGIELQAPAVVPVPPNPGLVTFFNQWRRDRGLS
nr:deaminase domain-containing protein [Stenotrophomonas sp. ISL-67]